MVFRNRLHRRGDYAATIAFYFQIAFRRMCRARLGAAATAMDTPKQKYPTENVCVCVRNSPF